VGWRLDNQGSLLSGGREVPLLHSVQTGSGNLQSFCPMENLCHFSGMKRLEREADFSPPCNAKINNALSYTSTPTYVYLRGA
jgi:hypothetical protein